MDGEPLTADTGIKTAQTIAELKADSSASVGDFYGIIDYETGHNSGTIFGTVVAGDTGADDGGSFIDLNNGLQLKQDLGVLTVKKFGAAGVITDNAVQFQNTVNYGAATKRNIGVNSDTYVIKSTPSYWSCL